MRTGSEPSQARSPLRLRLALALLGIVSSLAGIGLFAAVGSAAGMVACAALALVTVVNLAVVVMRIRQGPHFQPGPDVPPYRPAEHDPGERRPARPPRPARTRRRLYFALMGLCLTLFVLAWTWVRVVSPAAAIVMSVVAAVIPPLAAIVANAGGPITRRPGR
jgi:hypothetical protein